MREEGTITNAFAETPALPQIYSRVPVTSRRLDTIYKSTPDITHVVNRLASYTANPSIQHVAPLKRILRYLSGTRTYGITYSDSPNSPITFSSYADATYANADDCKSTSGYVFITANGAITWRSTKQTTVAPSSTEAEY
jgi:hypothetical protein